MGVSIVITSGKGGVGKTTTTANIGTALAAIGKKVVVVDGDTGLRNLDVLMGLENRIVYTIMDVIENRCRLKQALIKDKRYPSLFLLPTAQTKDKDDIKSEDMLSIVNELKEEFDYVIIDYYEKFSNDINAQNITYKALETTNNLIVYIIKDLYINHDSEYYKKLLLFTNNLISNFKLNNLLQYTYGNQIILQFSKPNN